MQMPRKLNSFDGHVGHLLDGTDSSECFIFVIPPESEEAKQNIRAAIVACEDALEPVPISESLENGCVYVVLDNGQHERAWYIRQGKDEEGAVEMILIDEGKRVMVPRDKVMKCPPEVAELEVFIVLCPVRIPNSSEELRQVVAKLVGQECRCVTSRVVIEPETMPHVKGRVLIQYTDGTYVDLKDIATSPSEGNEFVKFTFTPAAQAANDAPSGDDGTPPTGDQTNWGGFRTSTPFADHAGENFRSGGTFQRRGFNQFWQRGRGRGMFQGRGFGQRGGANFGRGGNFASSVAEEEQIPPPIEGSGFKQLEPIGYPKLIRVRYDREDREMPLNQFWVVDPAMFSTMERMLHEGRRRYNELPAAGRLSEELYGKGCLVRVVTGPSSMSICRAIIGQYSNRMKKMSVYLVDFGEFNWARAFELLDISVLPETDPVRAMHVAMFRCRMDQNSPIHVKDLVKGREYELWLLSKDSDGIFVVTVVPSDKTSFPRQPNQDTNQTPPQQQQPVEETTPNQTQLSSQASQQQPNTNGILLDNTGTTAAPRAATATNLAPYSSIWSPYSNIGLPYVMSLPVPVAVVATPPVCSLPPASAAPAAPTAPAVPTAPAAPAATGQGQDQKAATDQPTAGGGRSHSATRENNEPNQRDELTSGPNMRGRGRFRGGRWVGRGEEPRRRSFGTFDERGRRESFGFGGFEGRDDGQTREGGSSAGEGRGVFMRGRYRGGGEQPFRRGGRLPRRGGTTDNSFEFGRGRRDTTDSSFEFGRGRRGMTNNSSEFGRGRRGMTNNSSEFGRGRRNTTDSSFEFGRGRRDTTDNSLEFGRGRRHTADNSFRFGRGRRDTTGNSFEFGHGRRDTTDNSSGFGRGRGGSVCGGFFLPFGKEEKSKPKVKKVSSAWDLSPSRMRRDSSPLPPQEKSAGKDDNKDDKDGTNGKEGTSKEP